MKTLRAWLLGAALGAGLGYLFAPRHEDLLRAQLHDKRAEQRPGQQPTTDTTAASMFDQTSGYVGNTQTRIYHAATAPNLPGEENREYFADRAEAEAAGYRPSAQLASAR